MADPQHPSRRKPGRPNVVCIIADDTYFNKLGCYGGTPLTPNIDSIAREGVRFTEAFCTSSLCTPSRFSYLTGQHVGRCADPAFLHDCPYTEPYRAEHNAYLTEANPSIARILGAAGYRTGYFGKWHTGYPHNMLPLPRFDPTEDPAAPDVSARLRERQDVLDERVRRDGGFDAAGSIVWGNCESLPLRVLRCHHLEWITKGALDFLDACASDQPFLLYMASTEHHGPNVPESLDSDPAHTPEGLRTDHLDALPSRDEIRARVDRGGFVPDHDTLGMAWLDRQVEAVLKKIKEMGVEENTIFFFCVDHSVEPGKATCHDLGVHIPMLMKWPGELAAGSVCRGTVQNIDFLPTVLDLCGVKLPSDVPFDGHSFLPILRGEVDEIREDQFFELGFTRAVRTKKWKYIALRYPQRMIEGMRGGELLRAPNYVNKFTHPQSRIAPEYYPSYFDADQLFDLQNDPKELNNLAADLAYADVLVEMKARLQRHLDLFRHPFDLDDVEFLNSPRFRELADETRKIGTENISWWHGPPD
jgi:arylsulfatase A-like enzyme